MSEAMGREERVGNKGQAPANACGKMVDRVARAFRKAICGVLRRRERTRSRVTARAEQKWNCESGMGG